MICAQAHRGGVREGHVLGLPPGRPVNKILE